MEDISCAKEQCSKVKKMEMRENYRFEDTLVRNQDLPGWIDMPRELLIQELRERIQKHPHLRDREGVALDALTGQKKFKTRKEQIAVHRALYYSIIALVERKQGEVFCIHCNKSYPGREILCQKWSLDLGQLAGGGGRDFYCPASHKVIHTNDWRA